MAKHLMRFIDGAIALPPFAVRVGALPRLLLLLLLLSLPVCREHMGADGAAGGGGGSPLKQRDTRTPAVPVWTRLAAQSPGPGASAREKLQPAPPKVCMFVRLKQRYVCCVHMLPLLAIHPCRGASRITNHQRCAPLMFSAVRQCLAVFNNRCASLPRTGVPCGADQDDIPRPGRPRRRTHGSLHGGGPGGAILRR